MSTHAPLLFGKYKLLELIARGGMAEVFKAKSYGVEGFEKLVVIKRILPDLAQNQGFVEMFINEAKLSVALSHANIVQVFDLGREEDTYFIAMEFVHGMDFGEALRRARRSGARIPTEMCVYVASEMARALDYAHRRKDAQMRPLNIVHRDISPQNVLLSFEGEVKVTDFGIAKARKTIDEAGTIKGKYGYMAPEQAKGADVDSRADIYALGVVLYEALAGRNPFQAPTPYETLRRVQAGEKPPLNLANPDVPDELARIVDAALAPDRDQRYPSAARMYEDLAGFLYTTGKRVAGHDLSEWLQTLRDAPNREDDSHRMRDALEDIEPSAMKTPVEVPSSASHASRPATGSLGSVARQNLERRDVTFVSVEVASAASTFKLAQYEPIAAIASRYGGTVIDRSDDHVVLIFGAGEPDGRDTETALRCALKIHHSAQRAVPALEIGVGVHPARIHVSMDGEPQRDERLTSALAQVRDLARAADRRLLASEPVGRLIGELFAMQPVPPRGRSLERIPGTPLEVLGERAAHDGAHKKFVGRKEAFRKVGEILARANKRGSSAISLVGEAGTGKSRFLDEVNYRLRRMNHPVSWYSATSMPHERDVPLSAVQSMLRAIVGVDEADPADVIAERAQRLRELGLSADELRAVGVLLGAAGSSDATGTAARPLRAAVVRIATRLAQDQLTVLAWDGAENMDDESQFLVNELVRSAGRARVVVMVSRRPGFIYPWSDAPSLEEIALGPLAEEDARLLVVHRLGVVNEGGAPAELASDLWTKSAGNPLFIEEYLKALVESGAVETRDGAVVYRRDVAEVGVPKTLRGLVASRIARLTQQQRTLLQVAAVIGPRFHADLLAEVAAVRGAALESALRVLSERSIVSRDGGDEFSFEHELLREVVYEGLTLETRRQLHASVAGAIEALYPDRLDELAERLAQHLRESGDRDRAVTYMARAARRQLVEQAYAAATLSFVRALDLALSSPEPDSSAVVSLATELGAAAVRARQVGPSTEKVRLGLQFAERVGDDAATMRLLVLLGRLLALENRISDAVAQLEHARSLALRAQDNERLAEIVATIGEAYARNGEFKRAHQYLEEAARLADERGDKRDAAMALFTLARCEAASGERDRALTTWERARITSNGNEDPFTRVELEKTLALIHFHTRDYRASAFHSERATELAREFGLPYETCVNAHNQGDAWLRLGDYKKAFMCLKTSLDAAQEHGLEKMFHLNSLFLAFIDAAKFGSDAARAKIEAALSYAESQGYTWDILHAKYLLGVLAKEQGDRERARRLLREALTLADETDNRMYAEDCAALLAEVAALPSDATTPR